MKTISRCRSEPRGFDEEITRYPKKGILKSMEMVLCILIRRILNVDLVCAVVFLL